MTSTSSARSIHSGKRSLPPPDALCCSQKSIVLGDWPCLAAAPLLAGRCCCCCCSSFSRNCCCCCCCCCAWRLGHSPLLLLLLLDAINSLPLLRSGVGQGFYRGLCYRMLLLLPPPLVLLPLLPFGRDSCDLIA